MENSAKEPDQKPLRVTFRVALSTIFVVLLIITVAMLGILSYLNLRDNADNLSRQVLDQTSRRIDLWVKNLLSKANDQNQLNRATLGTIKIGPETFFRLSNYWRRVMETQPYFTFISVRLENGSTLSIERMKDDRLTIRESQIDREKRTLEFYDFWPEDYRERKAYNHKKIEFTTRQQTGTSWYTRAVEAGHPIWIEARTMRKGAETVAGVSFAAPFYGPEKELRGVTTVDFDIVAISKFLAANPVGKAGFAFIIEKPVKGEPRVIAHPTPDILTQTIVNERGLPQYEFVPYRKLRDVRVAGFMEQLSRKDLLQPGEDLHIFSYSADGKEYFGSYRKLTGKDMPEWIIASIIPRKEIMGFVDRNNLETLGIGLAAVFLILLASAWISGRISKPLRKIALESEAIGRFELGSRPLGHSMIKEVDRLMTATDDMKRGLRSFEKYVPTDVVRDIMASGGEAELGGRRANLTVFFSDIEGFTSIAEQVPPEDLVEQLAEYLGEMNQQIREEQGTVDKFIGDSIMAFWGAPAPNAEHALAACRAALLCRERLAVLQKKWKAEGKPVFAQRIGINTGEVIVGNMGSAVRMNYTVVGDPVNTASRLEGLNRYYGTRVIIGQSTHELVRDHFVTRPLDLVSVKGRHTGLRVYELMERIETAEEKKSRVAELTTAALDAYLIRRWDEAIGFYEMVLQLDAEDQTARLMLARCRQYREEPPPGDWTGIHQMQSK
jgi:adenylate cyclase